MGRWAWLIINGWFGVRDSALRLEEFRELVQEILQIAASTGPRGFFRSVQAGGAVLEVGRDYMVQLQQGVREPPEVSGVD